MQVRSDIHMKNASALKAQFEDQERFLDDGTRQFFSPESHLQPVVRASTYCS
jgi:hypothetical protein